MFRKIYYLAILTIPILILQKAAFGQNHNLIRTWIPHKPITTATNVSSMQLPQEVSRVSKYFDGFGRPVQTVSKQASPLGKDVVGMHVYDSWGRETKRYLPFVSSTDDGNYKNNALSQQNVFNQGMYPGENNYYYSKITLENSPLNRTLKTFAPGASWVGGSRGVSTQYLVNTAIDNVRIWNITQAQGSLPASSGAYPAGKLYKTITVDIKGVQTITYENTDGQTILKKVQLTASPDNGNGSSHAGWLCTYYVYDDYNHLRFIITPKAVQLIDGSWTISQTIANELCFRYEYDLKGRNIIQKVPGANEVQMVFDLRDRLAFSQDGNMRAKHQWLVTYYDGLDRPVETGLYSSSATRSSLQTMMNNTTTSYSQIPAPDDITINSRSGNSPVSYVARNSITFNPGFTSGSGDHFVAYIDPNATVNNTTADPTNNPRPPVEPSLVTPLTYTYYDDYSWNEHQAFKSSYLSKTTAAGNLYAENPTTYSKKTRGIITGTKVKILDSDPGKWLTTTIYCDDKGRILQTIASNSTGGTDVVTNKYDFSGKLLSSYVVNHNSQSTVTPETRVLTENKYDTGGRLLTVTKTINDNTSTKRIIATNTYNELSQLKTKTLGNSLETLTYDYNIRGWLTGINRQYTAGSGSHYFGMELGYDKPVTAIGTTTFSPLYNGNISGEIWKSKGDGIPRKYAFSYDNANRLKGAAFSQNSSGSSWDHATVDFSVSNLAYDANGNIMSMNQKGLITTTSGTVDNLTYSYQSNSNQLDHVTDNGGTSAALGDFKDKHTGSGDYAYDANGNLIKDLNKGISSITYNYLNLPENITVTGKGNIKFIYDAVGNKLQKIITDNTVSPTRLTTIDYVDGFVYQNDTLQFFPTQDGRVRSIPLPSGGGRGWAYDYFIKDHLGNTRVVLTEQTDFSQYLATMEPEKAQTEDALFYNLNSTRTAKPVDYPQDNITTPNTAVAKLNGKDPNKRIGPSIILKVMAGDTIQAAVRAFYKQQVTEKNNAGLPAEQMLAGLIQAFTAPGIQAAATHNARLASNPQITGPGLTVNDLQQLKNKDPKNKKLNKPKAYLNYVFFDNQFNFVNEGSGVKQVNGEPGQLETLSSGKVVVKKDGYVYVYTSNESEQDVLFDNFGVMDITGPVLEETHYYPYGLTMAGISTVAPLKIANRHKFNGIELNRKEFSDGSGLDLYTAEFRGLDPQIGRWWQIDPKAASFAGWSPYNAMMDNPVSFSDPNGDCPICLAVAIGAIVGAGINVATHWSQITAGGQFHWDKFGEAALIGGGAGAIGVLTGGAGFAAAGGAAAGIGGFLAGAAGGAIGSAYASGIQDVGNAIAFGDPLPTPLQFLEGIGFGAITGGVFNGFSALANGRNFWNGRLLPKNFILRPLEGQIGIQTGQRGDVNVPQNVSGSSTLSPYEKGQLGLRMNGIKQNTVRIESPSKTVSYRVPDELDVGNKVIGEVKHYSTGRTVRFTKQIADYMRYAYKKGYTFKLYVPNGVNLAPAIQYFRVKGFIQVVNY